LPYSLKCVEGEFYELSFEKFAESMKPQPMRPGLSVAGRIRGG
jgi:hypothetical protein